MNIDKFIELANKRQEQYPDLRLGQVMFDLLLDEEPEIANKLRATKFDPYYRDDLITSFLEWLRKEIYMIEQDGEVKVISPDKPCKLCGKPDIVYNEDDCCSLCHERRHKAERAMRENYLGINFNGWKRVSEGGFVRSRHV